MKVSEVKRLKKMLAEAMHGNAVQKYLSAKNGDETNF